jgi:hypothetical protein
MVKNLKDIAYGGHNVAIENLPYPITHYPGFYGAFFGFQKNKNSEITFCSCAKEAIENYIKLRLLKGIPLNSDPERRFILDRMYFPEVVVRELINHKVKNDSNVISHLQFKNKLCHECNRIIPKYRYCHEMYGGAFKQNYGWYINKQSFEWGIEPISYCILPTCCPEEILELMNNTVSLTKHHSELMRKAFERRPPKVQYLIPAQKLGHLIEKRNRKILNIIENEVRLKFGHKKIGEAWTSETILYYIIESLFPYKTIFRHYRPTFLKGLELDIFIKELNVGIEYQGLQHFKPVKHWGGVEGLNKLKCRDKIKKRLCDSKGVRLIYFNYDEGLSNDLVLKKLQCYGVKC